MEGPLKSDYIEGQPSLNEQVVLGKNGRAAMVHTPCGAKVCNGVQLHQSS